MRVYSREFRMQVVQRLLAGEKVPVVAQELGIHRKLLYEWVRRVKDGGEANLRDRGRPRKDSTYASAGDDAQKKIAELERAIAHQQLIIEFFRHALQQVEELRHKRSAIGATASSTSSRI
jgi:transposase-like protein